jgi:hypothetical protein
MRAVTRRMILILLCWLPAVLGVLFGMPPPDARPIVRISSHGGIHYPPDHVQNRALIVCCLIVLSGIALTICLRALLDCFGTKKPEG